jgi:hypothetical protein
MEKLEHQIVKFIEQYKFKSEMDWRFISSFCKVELKLTFDKEPEISPDGIDCATFSEWYDNGFKSGEVAWLDGNLVIIGACNLSVAKIEGTLTGDTIQTKRFEEEPSKLLKASDDDARMFYRKVTLNGLQYCENRQLLVERRIPQKKERVSFRKENFRGVGVIRNISLEENWFELYCYHIYQTDETRYSMHERIPNFNEYTFDAMTIAERKRLENKLVKLGKSWNSKLYRIEPAKPKADFEQKYWYISDTMKVNTDTERMKPTSHARYLGGNYFLTIEDCQESLNKIKEILRDSLAR